MTTPIVAVPENVSYLRVVRSGGTGLEGAAGFQHQKPLYSVAEAAELLTVCRDTVYTMVRSGELGHVRVRRVLRIPAAAIDEWIQSHIRHGYADGADYSG
jgi:excisionase family DNA binding protein